MTSKGPNNFALNILETSFPTHVQVYLGLGFQNNFKSLKANEQRNKQTKPQQHET